jgi:hypothetical protein
MSTFGFVIAQRSWPDEIKLATGMKTFGFTIGEAWRRHIGPGHDADFPILVQRWNERGYGPHRVEVALSPEPELSLSPEEMAALRDALADLGGDG